MAAPRETALETARSMLVCAAKMHMEILQDILPRAMARTRKAKNENCIATVVVVGGAAALANVCVYCNGISYS